MAKGDAFCYSPDIGQFVNRDGILYTEHGEVFKEPVIIRSLVNYIEDELPPAGYVNFADWSDEQRASAKAKFDDMKTQQAEKLGSIETLKENVAYNVQRAIECIRTSKFSSRALNIVVTKLEEAELWLGKV